MRPAGLLACLLAVGAAGHLEGQCPDGSPPPCGRAASRSTVPPTSLAVLYFENASRDTADAYLAEGITEEIISRLSEVARLQVKSRYQVRRYRTDTTGDAAEIGRQLAVARIVTGSVRRAGNRLRVTAEMVRTATGDVVWRERYDRADTDVLSLQEDLASAVATAVTGRLLPAERAVLAAQPTRNPAAYDAYLLGRFYWNKRTAPDLVAAAAHFEQAIRADSNYAQAWSGLADAYVLFLPAEYRPRHQPRFDPDSGRARRPPGTGAGPAARRGVRVTGRDPRIPPAMGGSAGGVRARRRSEPAVSDGASVVRLRSDGVEPMG